MYDLPEPKGGVTTQVLIDLCVTSSLLAFEKKLRPLDPSVPLR